ncbi:hypothetical protein Zmor_020742 [Zophobas morio]|uniref:Uncharacterized protein n=1 Tax=Zophobas morio TaxID=2755281 RepID=A0AA38I4L3_9CUCU|nr:hypothetical protein Zmor_020742 [Zophobas morio]
MSSHGRIPFKLNLLLKQQNVNEIENRFEIKYESLSVETSERIRDEVPEDLDNEKTSLALTLTKWQIDEKSSYLEYKSMWEQYEVLKRNLECVYHYFTCVKLTAKATKEVANIITNLDIQEDTIGAFEEIENDNLEQNVLELIHDNEIRMSWNEMEMRKKDYDIATKNFRILLEIIDFSWDELNQLKKQYNDVFLKYQHARSELRKLPALLEKMKDIFYSCLQLLGSNVDEFLKSTASLNNLLKSTSEQLIENKELDDS